jgi:hypothetical protein
MIRISVVALASLIACDPAVPQSISAANPLEGFWQDTGRRILYSRVAPAAYDYGAWQILDQAQTYPAAKELRRTPRGWQVLDLNFDDADYSISGITASAQSLEFVRTEKWSGCTMQHRCSLIAADMICALENQCPSAGEMVVGWRGEERYARRVSCERLGRVQLQGFPVACR